jgi:hypothetical protein
MANPPRFFPAVPIPAMPEREVLSFLFTQTERGRERHFVRLCFKHRDHVFHALEGAFYMRGKSRNFIVLPIFRPMDALALILGCL